MKNRNNLDDMIRKYLRRAFCVARCQARYRSEEWHIDLDTWMEHWMEDDKYLQKGQRIDDYCFARIDFDLPWTDDNVCVIKRKEVLNKQHIKRRANK